MSAGDPAGGDGRPSFRAVFAVDEFRPLFGTFTLSTIGDELARVALTVLVYQRTDSPLLAAFTFALSFLPWAVGGPVLATLADRFPRHRVLITSDVLRAGLVALMAVPGTPLAVLVALLFAVSLCAPPFESARSALMADVLEGERYAVATSLTNVSLQLAQVIGFVAAGALVTAFSPSVVLLLDAATFAVSALWLAVGLQRRPAPVESSGEPSSVWREAGEGLRLIGGSPRLLAIIALLWTGTLFANAAEGIAAPLTDDLGEGAVALGVLLAANPMGVTIGGLVVARLLGTARSERLLPALVVLSLAPVLLAGLVALAAGPGRGAYVLVVGLLFVAGLGASWTIPLNVAFVQAVPPAMRGRAFGVAVSGLYGVQGLGALGAGLAAEGVPAAAVVAIAGGVGLVAVVPCLLALVRSRPGVAGRHRAAGPSVP
ncbi:Predicted arabinose efflux permease, MFS family [Geodermatophilus obscurus]|uniref:Predicted arabinose efflux permease, MFS family n=1 Tax=Geodermatophilus obscurus TaxID=1861 RepID=A0A1I5HRG1_9ACTN|nr:MFS transporter [Geodermatophilus obscurus]SFO50867.1 Predicted arabinose efflux permease, MFS family [Geodermatophilus obscurus]